MGAKKKNRILFAVLSAVLVALVIWVVWGNTNMLVSRGVGNSAFPFRVNNRPEVILVELNTNE